MAGRKVPRGALGNLLLTNQFIVSVRVKIFICLIGVGLLLWLSAAFLAARVFQNDFEQLDRQRIARNVNHVYGLIRGSEDRARSACQLWLANPPASPVTSEEFMRSILEANQIDFMAVFDARGALKSSFELRGGTEAATPQLPQADQTRFVRLIEESRQTGRPVSGIVESALGPLIFAASAATKPGSESGVVAAIFLNESFGRSLKRNLLMDVRIVPATDELLAKFPRGREEALFAPQDLAESNLIGARLLKDIQGNPLLVLEIVATKEIAVAGKRNLQFFLGATAAFGIIVIVAGTLLVDFWVSRRIRRLTQSARHADQYGVLDLPKRFTKVPDEISQLAQATQRMVERMRSAQTLYRAVIETQTEMIVRYRPDGSISFTNEAFAKWLNLHPKSVLEAKLPALLANRSSDADQLSVPLDPTQRERIVHLRVRDKDGHLRTLEWTEHGVFDSQRTLLEIQALGRDVTEQVEHEARLQEAREQAEIADRAKGEFLAVLGHETRTPLTTILGFTTVLEGTPLNEDQKDYLSVIRSSGNALLVLLNDILDYTRIAAGQIELHPSTVDVTNVIKEIISTHVFEARSKQLTLDTEIGQDTPLFIEADEARLKQVLSNLVDNAIKFTQSGFVRLGIHAVEPDRIRFFVEDSGSGIPPEKRHLLFRPFSQLDSALTRDTGGTGIGLAFSKRLVELMGGNIGEGDERSPGAFFYFELPIGRPVIPKRAIARFTDLSTAPDVTLSTGIRILLVEDNKVNQKLTTRMLEILGYSCDVASNGIECLEKSAEKDYDVVFLDIQMPLLDGFETARRIRKREAESPAKHRSYLIALTAFTLPGDREKCLAAGMDNFVGKPIRPENLEAAIESWREESLTAPH